MFFILKISQVYKIIMQSSTGKNIPAPRIPALAPSCSIPVVTPAVEKVPVVAKSESKSVDMITEKSKDGNPFLLYLCTGLALLGSAVFMNKRNKKSYQYV
jgi:hypothetical protein